jgi:tRNA-dihydrouridine synthase
MRAFSTHEETASRALELAHAGCSFISLHGRTREAVGDLAGVADWEAIAAVKRAVHVPVIACGGIRGLADAELCLATTGADAVMLGEALEANPRALRDARPSAVDVAKECV